MYAWQDVHLNICDNCGDGRAALSAALSGDVLCDSPGCSACDPLGGGGGVFGFLCASGAFFRGGGAFHILFNDFGEFGYHTL